MSERDRTLQAYIDRVMVVREKQQDQLEASQLREIAIELGLTEAEMDAIEAAAEEHRQRGMGYLQHQRYDDAIRELDDAAALSPLRLEVLQTLVVAHRDRWRARRDENDRQRATELARRCLELEPAHEISYRILNELDPATEPRAERLNLAPILLGIGALLILFGLAFGLRLLSHAAVSGSQTGTPPAVAAPPATAATAPHAVASSGERDIPIDWLPGANGAGLGYASRLSRLEVYPSRTFFKLQAQLNNDSSDELEVVKIELELLDERGNVIASDALTALDDHDAALRPGDRKVFEALKKTSPAVAAARLQVTRVERTAAAARYPESAPLSLTWAFPKPTQFDLSAAERFAQVSDFSGGMRYQTLELELTNRGQTAIDKLKLQWQALNKDGKVIDSQAFYGALRSGPKLLPGETRVLRRTVKVAGEYEGYQLRVLELE